MELIINPLGFHYLRDKTYNETTRQVGTSLDSTVSIGPAEYVTERPLNRDDFFIEYFTTRCQETMSGPLMQWN